MVSSSQVLTTKLLIHIPHSATIENIKNLPGTESGAVADIFDKQGAMVLKPCPIAEKFHPSDVLFRLDVASPNLKGHLAEMAKLGHMGFDNFSILLSGVRDLKDLYEVRIAAGEAGLGVHTRFGLSVEYPSLATLHEEALKKGPSFVMMDLDTLGERLLGSGADAGTGIHPSVLKIIGSVGKSCRRHGVSFGVSGKALRDSDAVAQLVREGVGFFVTPHENAEALKKMAFHAEKKRELEFLKSKLKMQFRKGRI